MSHIWQLHWFVICLFQVHDKNNETTRSYDLLNDRHCSKNITTGKIIVMIKSQALRRELRNTVKKVKQEIK